MKRKIPVWIALLLVVLVGAAAGAMGAVLGYRDGVGEGLAEGERRANVKAARQPPVVTFDRKVSADAIFTPERMKEFPANLVAALEDADTKAAVTRILNRAPSSCYRLAVKGISLASSLVADPQSPNFCATALPQVYLAWAAYNTFADEQEAIAVLKIERRRKINLEGRDRLGPPDAPVTLIEFADYQCPYCVRAKPLIEKMLERGDVNFVFKHLPLGFHHAALPAAYAVEAAAKQGKRWEMHAALFALGKSITEGIDRKQPLPESGPVPFEAQAKELGLDVEQFRKDVRDPAVQKTVKDDMAEAKRLNVSSTPSFFINQRRVVEGRSPKMLNKLIDRAKKEAVEGKFSWGLDEVPGPKKIPSEDAPGEEAAKDAPEAGEQ